MKTAKMRNGLPARARAFVPAELVMVLVVLATGVGLLAVATRQGRSGAGLAGSLGNLKRIGEAGASYAADFDDQLWSFTWSEDEHPTQYSDLMNPRDNATAVMFQTVDMVRRLSGDDSIPRIENRFRPPFTSTLVLADYVGESLPAEWMVSPGDAVRLEWQANPDDIPGFGDQGGKAWERLFGLYGSSYGLMTAFWAPDEKVGSQSTVYQFQSQHDLFWVPRNVEFGKRRLAEMAHPSAKVQVAEREAYFFGTRASFYLDPASRVPLLTADGSAGPRTTGEANSSFLPNNPDDQSKSTLLDYTPNPVYEAATMSGSSVDSGLDGSFKWTRRGLKGVDFNGERAE